MPDIGAADEAALLAALALPGCAKGAQAGLIALGLR
jgi:hypothetical protein